MARLVWALGAMAAERVFYGENSSGVGGDVQSATAQAAFMGGASAMGPEPFAVVPLDDETEEDARKRLLQRFEAIGLDVDYAARHLEYYTRRLAAGGKFELTIWPYHSMLGGIGHALVSAVEEAIFFHSVARHSQPAPKSPARQVN